LEIAGGPLAPDPSGSGVDGGGGRLRRDTERDTLVSALEVANGTLAARGVRLDKVSNRPIELILVAFRSS
jgi:hypothetical protein